jgi:hypothetical protein
MAEQANANPPVNKDEQIGYHKGSINTLLAERSELIRMASITEQLINAHAQELEKLGVKLQQQPSNNTNNSQPEEKKK